MQGIPVAMNDIPKMLHLYLACSPKLDLEYRCLPRSGGWVEQDYETITWFTIIENRVREILVRKQKDIEAKSKKPRR